MKAFLLGVLAAIAIAAAAGLVLNSLDWSSARIYRSEAVRL